MKYTDLAFKILSVLVIPLLLWGIKLEVSNAVQTEKIIRLEKELDTVKPHGEVLARLGEKIDGTNRRLEGILNSIRRTLPPSP